MNAASEIGQSEQELFAPGHDDVVNPRPCVSVAFWPAELEAWGAWKLLASDGCFASASAFGSPVYSQDMYGVVTQSVQQQQNTACFTD